MLLHPGPHTPGCPGKISLENKSISLCRLYATLNIKLNPCSTSQGHSSETVHHLQTSDMASQFLHCQQCGSFLIGTNDLQVCPWAIGLLLGQLLCLPAREDSEWDDSEGPGNLAPSCALLTLYLGEQEEWDHLCPCWPLPLRTISLHQQVGMTGEN